MGLQLPSAANSAMLLDIKTEVRALVERVYLHLIFTQKDNLWLKKIIKGHKRPIKAVEGG